MKYDEIQNGLQSNDTAIQIKAVQDACRSKRSDLLRDLFELLGSHQVGYFVMECLPSFGEVIAPELRAILHGAKSSKLAKERASSILAHFGDHEAVPILLKAIETPGNQFYINRIIKLAPEELGKQVETILRDQIDLASTTTDPIYADYFAKLILTIQDLGAQQRVRHMLERLLRYGHHWLIQAAAAEALYPIDPTYYHAMIIQLAEHDNREVLMKLLQRLTAG